MNPVAIVGRSGLFPNSPTLDSFWDNIVERRDMTSEATSGRWRLEPKSVLVSRGSTQNTVRTLRGGYVNDVPAFDSSALQLTPEESATMDTIHQWVLQTAAGALADGAEYRPFYNRGCFGQPIFPDRLYERTVRRNVVPRIAKRVGRCTSVAPFYVWSTSPSRQKSIGTGWNRLGFGLCMCIGPDCYSTGV